MNDLFHFWNLRSQRERNLISVSLALIILMTIFSVFSWVISNTKSSKTKMIAAKNDYEYVYKGAIRLLGKASSNLLKGNPSQIYTSINALSSEQNLKVLDIRLKDQTIVIELNVETFDQITGFLESMHSKLGLKLTKFDLISSDDQKTATLIYTGS